MVSGSPASPIPPSLLFLLPELPPSPVSSSWLVIQVESNRCWPAFPHLQTGRGSPALQHCSGIRGPDRRPELSGGGWE